MFINLFSSKVQRLNLFNYTDTIMFQLKENQQSLHSRTGNLLLHYHTIHHLTQTAATRIASYWTARLCYLLLTVYSFKSLCTQPLCSQ
jgi:hypothetical protein